MELGKHWNTIDGVNEADNVEFGVNEFICCNLMGRWIEEEL